MEDGRSKAKKCLQKTASTFLSFRLITFALGRAFIATFAFALTACLHRFGFITRILC